LGYVLALLGGIIIIALGLASIARYPTILPFQVPLAGYFGIGVISLILGIVAVFGSKRVNELIWGVVLMAVGFLAGGIGGLLAILGGLVGLPLMYV
jgi:MFS superfamily sulfate permease-like transporter